jgi:hypothetical protein
MCQRTDVLVTYNLLMCWHFKVHATISTALEERQSSVHAAETVCEASLSTGHPPSNGSESVPLTKPSSPVATPQAGFPVHLKTEPFSPNASESVFQMIGHETDAQVKLAHF